MIRVRRGICFRSVCCVMSLMLSCNLLLAGAVDQIVISKMKLVQVQNVGDSGIRMTKNSGMLGPAEGLRYRIDLYGPDNKLIDLRSLPIDQKKKIVDALKLKCRGVNPLGSQVLMTSGNIPIDFNHKGGLYVSTTTGAGQGAARIEVTSKVFPKAKAVKLISTGNTSTIGGANTVPPKPAPDMFLPVLLGVGAAGALVVGLAVASGAVAQQQEWYISTPSGYRNIGGASNIGPYGSQSEAQSVNNSFFNGGGRVYQAKQADVGFTKRHILSDYRMGLETQ